MCNKSEASAVADARKSSGRPTWKLIECPSSKVNLIHSDYLFYKQLD